MNESIPLARFHSVKEKFAHLNEEQQLEAVCWMPPLDLIALLKSDFPLAPKIQEWIHKSTLMVPREVCVLLVSNKNMAPEIARSILISGDKYLIEQVAKNPATPVDILIDLTRSESLSAALAAYCNPAVNGNENRISAMELIGRCDRIQMGNLAASETTPPELLEAIMFAIDREVSAHQDLPAIEELRGTIFGNPRTLLAKNPALPNALGDRLLRDPNASVRSLVTRNLKERPGVVKSMLFDLSLEVREAAISRIYEIQSEISVTEICEGLFGIKSGRLMGLISDALKKGLPLSWMVSAGGILRFVFEGNRHDFVRTLCLIADEGAKDGFMLANSFGVHDCHSLGTFLKMLPKATITDVLLNFSIDRKVGINPIIRAIRSMMPHFRSKKNELSSLKFADLKELAAWLNAELAVLSPLSDDKNFNLNEPGVYKTLKELNNKQINTEYSLVVPDTATTLKDWGSQLENCIGNGSYAVQAAMGRIVLIGLRHKSGFIKYCMEFSRDGRLNQAKGLKNCSMPNNLKKLTRKILSESTIFKKPV